MFGFVRLLDVRFRVQNTLWPRWNRHEQWFRWWGSRNWNRKKRDKYVFKQTKGLVAYCSFVELAAVQEPVQGFVH